MARTLISKDLAHLVGEIKQLYAKQHGRSGKAPQPKIYWLWSEVVKRCMTYEDCHYVIKHLGQDSKGNRLKVVRKSLPMCDSVKRIMEIFPFVGVSWKKERQDLLRRLAELTKTPPQYFNLLIKLKVL